MALMRLGGEGAARKSAKPNWLSALAIFESVHIAWIFRRHKSKALDFIGRRKVGSDELGVVVWCVLKTIRVWVGQST